MVNKLSSSGGRLKCQCLCLSVCVCVSVCVSEDTDLGLSLLYVQILIEHHSLHVFPNASRIRCLEDLKSNILIGCNHTPRMVQYFWLHATATQPLLSCRWGAVRISASLWWWPGGYPTTKSSWRGPRGWEDHFPHHFPLQIFVVQLWCCLVTVSILQESGSRF